MITIGIRGLAGKPFSLGVDELVKKIHNKVGGYANTFAWTEFDTIFNFLKNSHHDPKSKIHGPIIIVGHSLGARTAVKLFNELKKAGVPVRLLVCLDYVRPAFPFSLFPSTWYKVNNGMAYHFTSKDLRVAKLPGAVVVPHYELNHIELDDNEEVHKEILELVSKHV